MMWLMAVLAALLTIVVMAVAAILAFYQADRARPDSWRERFWSLTVVMCVLSAAPFSLLAALFAMIRYGL